MPQPSFHVKFGPLKIVPLGFDVVEQGSEVSPNLLVSYMDKESQLGEALNVVLSRFLGRGMELRSDGFYGLELHVLSAKHSAAFAALVARARAREEERQLWRKQSDDPDDPDRRDYVRLAFAIVPNPRGSVRFYFSKPLFGPGDLPTRFPEPRRGALREDRNRSSSRAHSLGSEQLARTASRHAANKAAPIYIQRVTPRKARKHDWVRVTETSETSSSTTKRS